MPQTKYSVDTHVSCKNKKKRTQSLYLTWKEKVQLMKECGDAAVILLEFFFSKAGTPDYEFNDKKSAKALGWSTSKVRFVRTRLQKANYFYSLAARNVRNKRRYVFISLGKEAVLEKKAQHNKM
jgi:hypothetical protein